MQEPNDSFVRPKRFSEILGICRTTLYQKVKNGDIPAPIKIGARAVAWPMSQVNEVVDKIKKHHYA